MVNNLNKKLQAATSKGRKSISNPLLTKLKKIEDSLDRGEEMLVRSMPTKPPVQKTCTYTKGTRPRPQQKNSERNGLLEALDLSLFFAI